METKREELKPCPFCGGPANLCVLNDNAHFVVCQDCGAHVWCGDMFTVDSVIKAWERRSDNAR